MRILVIEDEPKLANAVKKLLEQEHFAVDACHDGDNGYAMASTEPYDAMIIDRMIPGEYDGIELVRALRKEKIHTPILFLTALSAPSDATTGLNTGADDYLAKPFDADELLARIRALLRRPLAHQSTVLRSGSLSIDTTSLTVQRDKSIISLTAKEYALLEYLLRNKGRIVSKDSITQHVWDYDADILPNTVEVYIKYLRAKIDKPFANPLIQTVRGFGYRLKDEA